ncbi:MAG: hypothetical protein INR66_21015 [Gordonia polyisoprenivorans]|nr:hypothetical protein [Gordonia polyisoprenivorans]
MTDDEFFTSTDELQTIRQWAHARYAAVWAVFGAVLLRVAATTEPTVQLPGVIGGRASLNLLAAFVAPSGGGKGISDKVARLAWPAPIIERPIGSGEGIAATFMPPKKEGQEPITRAVISVPEVDTLAGLASRQGSILLAQLKSMAMGEQLGQSNASDATTRIIPAHTYRACLSVGAQPTHTGVLFDDTTGGTPQRFLWFPTIDPDMPSDEIDDPAPLDTRLPMWTAADDGVVQIGYGPDEIRTTIIAAHLARQRGESDALDGHAMLTRCKVAAVLAILHKRSVVSDEDWELSGVVMAQSARTRDWVIAESRKAARQKVRDRALARAAGEEFIDERLLERVKRSIVGMLDRDGEQASSDLRRRLGKREKRDLFDQAAAELEHEGLIQTAPGRDRGVRYRSGHGDQAGHPEKAQVNRGDRTGHGDQIRPTHEFTGEPEFTPESRRSTAVTSEFTGEPNGRTLPADTPRLRSVESPDPAQKVTCSQWFADHVQSLIDTGTETVLSKRVFDAGRDAGWQLGNLRQAASASPLVATIERTAEGSIWRLGAGHRNTAVTARQWLLAWLQTNPGWHYPSDIYTAGENDGHSQVAIRQASKSAPIVKRGDSPRAMQWQLDPDYIEETA